MSHLCLGTESGHKIQKLDKSELCRMCTTFLLGLYPYVFSGRHTTLVCSIETSVARGFSKPRIDIAARLEVSSISCAWSITINMVNN